MESYRLYFRFNSGIGLFFSYRHSWRELEMSIPFITIIISFKYGSGVYFFGLTNIKKVKRDAHTEETEKQRIDRQRLFDERLLRGIQALHEGKEVLILNVDGDSVNGRELAVEIKNRTVDEYQRFLMDKIVIKYSLMDIRISISDVNETLNLKHPLSFVTYLENKLRKS